MAFTPYAEREMTSWLDSIDRKAIAAVAAAAAAGVTKRAGEGLCPEWIFAVGKGKCEQDRRVGKPTTRCRYAEFFAGQQRLAFAT